MTPQTQTAGNNTPALLDEYMTPDETATALGIGKRTLDRWHSLREGPPRTTLGRRILYRRDAVKAWLRAQEKDQVAA